MKKETLKKKVIDSNAKHKLTIVRLVFFYSKALKEEKWVGTDAALLLSGSDKYYYSTQIIDNHNVLYRSRDMDFCSFMHCYLVIAAYYFKVVKKQTNKQKKTTYYFVILI